MGPRRLDELFEGGVRAKKVHHYLCHPYFRWLGVLANPSELLRGWRDESVQKVRGVPRAQGGQAREPCRGVAEGSREGVGGQAKGGQAAVPVSHEQWVLLRKEQCEHQAQQQRRVEVLRKQVKRAPVGVVDAGRSGRLYTIKTTTIYPSPMVIIVLGDGRTLGPNPARMTRVHDDRPCKR